LVSGGLTNTYQSGFIYSIIHVMQEHFMPVNGNMENHPGKQYNHNTYGSVLAEQLENLVLGMLLPERGWGLTVDGV
jgi:hypothetical protein